MGGVHGQGDPLTDQTEWVLDRIVELFPTAESTWEPPIAIQTIMEAIAVLEGREGTLFGLANTVIDPSKVEQMLGLLRDALAAWRGWAELHREDLAAWMTTSQQGRLT